MATWGQVNVGSAAPAPLVDAGAGPVLLQNGDVNNTVWLGDDPFDTVAGDTTNVSPLPPLGFVAVDGKDPVYGICAAGQTAVISRYGGGQSFFQLVELIVKTLIISGSVGNGLYDYSPSAGLGNLVASISQALVDPFGNQVHPGITAYSGSDIGNLAATGLEVIENGHLAGTLLVSQQMWQLAGAFYPLVVENAVALDPVALNVPETWHPISLAAGWSTVAGQPIPSYRLLPDGTVELCGVATHAAFTATTALSSVNLPAPYRPASIMVVSGNSLSEAPAEVTTAGLINAFPGGVSCTACRFSGIYPLNL